MPHCDSHKITVKSQTSAEDFVFPRDGRMEATPDLHGLAHDWQAGAHRPHRLKSRHGKCGHEQQPMHAALGVICCLHCLSLMTLVS